MIFAAKLLSTIVLGVAGLVVFEWGLRAIRNRERLRASVPVEAQAAALRFGAIWTALTLSAGASMIAAAILVWSDVGSAILLGLWPPLLASLAAAINRRRGA